MSKIKSAPTLRHPGYAPSPSAPAFGGLPARRT